MPRRLTAAQLQPASQPVSPGHERHDGCSSRQLHGIPTKISVRDAHIRAVRARSRGRVRVLLRGDRGAVSVELVIATPLLLLLLLAIVQFALWSHATHIAQAAASQALAAARTQDGTAAAGAASAREMLDQLAGGPLTGASVSADRTATSASIAISGTAVSVIPFLHLPVHAEAVGPVERFVPDVDGFANSESMSGGNPDAGGIE